MALSELIATEAGRSLWIDFAFLATGAVFGAASSYIIARHFYRRAISADEGEGKTRGGVE